MQAGARSLLKASKDLEGEPSIKLSTTKNSGLSPSPERNSVNRSPRKKDVVDLAQDYIDQTKANDDLLHSLQNSTDVV